MSTPVFDDGTLFRALADYSGETGWIEVDFAVRNNPLSPSTPEVSALEIAEAISAVVEAKGYPPLVFRGPQAVAELNP